MAEAAALISANLNNMRANLMGLAVVLLLSLTSAAGFSDTNNRKTSSETNAAGEKTEILYQPNEANGGFELKQTDAKGNIRQWYQNFEDGDGKVLIAITRKTVGSDDSPPYASIQFISRYTYRPDGNILEEDQFYGDGRLREKIVHQYDDSGKWLKGLIFDNNGKRLGTLLTPPEAFLYGDKKKNAR